jgi:hypothetical protein
MWVSNEIVKSTVEPGGFIKDNNEVKAKKSKSNKDESKNLSSSEGGKETIVSVSAALEGSPCVSVNSYTHTNVTSSN